MMQAIFFDVDDTLYDQLTPFARSFEKHFNFYDIPLEALYTTSRKLSDEVFHLTENGQMNTQDMYVYRIKQALAYFGKQISYEKAAMFQKDYQEFQREIKLIPEVEDVLSFCVEKQITMGIITNGPFAHQERKIKQLKVDQWIPANHIFISSKVGYAKPDVNIFRLAETTLGLTDKHIYYVGDSFQNDIIGAKNADWKAVWYNRRSHKKIPNTVEPDYIADKNTLFEVIHKIELENEER